MSVKRAVLIHQGKQLVDTLEKGGVSRPVGYVTPGGFVKTAKGWRKASKAEIETGKKPQKEKEPAKAKDERTLTYAGEDVWFRSSEDEKGYGVGKLYGVKGDTAYIEHPTRGKLKVPVSRLERRWQDKIEEARK